MAQPTGSGLGPLSRKRKASRSPSPAPIRDDNFSKAKWLADFIEELDEIDLEKPLEFSSVGDIGECGIAALGPAKQDGHGNPVFYIPKVDFDDCFSNLPSGLHEENIPRYQHQIRQIIFLMHLWLVQLGDVRLRTLRNIQAANSFWNSEGSKTWGGRTYAYYQNWLPDAIWRLRTDILWICGHGKQGRLPRPGPVKGGDFPLLSEGWRQCKERAQRNKISKAKEKPRMIGTRQKIKNLCHQVIHEFTGDSSKPKGFQANAGKIITSIVDGLCTTYSGRITRSKHAVGLKMQVRLSGASKNPTRFPKRYPEVNLCGHAIDEEDLPIASRTRNKSQA